jgi:type I restriction enzyme S subunit
MKLPKGWDRVAMNALGSVQAGRQRSPHHIAGELRPYLRVANVQDGWIDFRDVKQMLFTDKEAAIYELRPGDILLSEGQSLELVGRPAIYRGDVPRCCFQNTLVRLRPDGHNPDFVLYVCQYLYGLGVFQRIAKKTTSIAHLGVSRFAEVTAPVPPLPEQRKIADILSTWDEALTQLDDLIEAQDRRKKALMQQLLTGRRRLKGFDQSKGKTASDRFGTYPADWKRVRLGEIANEVPTKNADGTDLPVLSCTKHRGLVLSQEYFGKRVYAEDTSGYRVVQRGEFAYATNHIEEGSIGYQNICDAGLVSPIYTVFKTTEAVDDSYLFRVLKSPLLIHFYQINTSASVDRRGSLRYDEFSRIHIWLPSKEEQKAMAQVFDMADQQLTLLRIQRTALDQQKRGLMQRLLTGKLRINA